MDYKNINWDRSIAINGIEQVAKNTEQILERLSQQQENFTLAVNELSRAILKLAEKR